MRKIGVIGGSGVYNFDNVEVVKKHVVETPFGHPSGPIMELKIEDNHFFFSSSPWGRT